jgi:short-subunit dehydrogenase
MRFPYRTAVITGASTGIGRALALQLAEEGCAVGLLARRKELLDEVASEAHRRGVRAAVADCDVTDRQAVYQAVGKLRGDLGPIDLLVANAGVGDPTPAERFDVARVEHMYRVNVLGALYAIAAVLPEMLERGRGHIVGISSLASYRGFPRSSTYCATKAALRIQLEGLRVELAPRGVFVTTICPGFVRTPMTEKNLLYMPFLLEPAVAARKIVAAIRRRRRVYNFPWQTALLVWLLAHLPNWLYDRLTRPYKRWVNETT